METLGMPSAQECQLFGGDFFGLGLQGNSPKELL